MAATNWTAPPRDLLPVRGLEDRRGVAEPDTGIAMNDYLREYLGLTGTKFGCGAAQCLSCAVIIDNPDGTSYTSPTCIVSAANFNGKSIRT